MIASAASASMHAAEFCRRELLAMRRMKDGNRQSAPDTLLTAIVAAAKGESNNADVEQLSHFPWFAFVVQFVAARLCDDMDAVRCSNALALAVPVGVRSPRLGGLIRRLSKRNQLPDV